MKLIVQLVACRKGVVASAEYGVLLALVAAGSLAAATKIGSAVTTFFTSVSSAL